MLCCPTPHRTSLLSNSREIQRVSFRGVKIIWLDGELIRSHHPHSRSGETLVGGFGGFGKVDNLWHHHRRTTIVEQNNFLDKIWFV